MAASSTIERNTVKSQTENQNDPEWIHNAKMEEYRRVLYSGLDVAQSDVADDLEVPASAERASVFADAAPAHREEPAQPEQPVRAADRLAAYHAYPAPATRRNLFEGIALRNGELVSELPTQEMPAAPAASAATAPAAPAVSIPEADEEDARPTPRTMASIHASTRTEAGVRQGFFASLSTRTKAVLLAVAAAVVFAIILICINTAIINSLNAQISEKQAAVEELAAQSQSIKESIAEITDPEAVRQWAESMGMAQS